MSVGGKVIESKIFHDKVYINTKDGGAEYAIFVDRDENSENVEVDDIVWWQGEIAFWTTSDRETKVETVLNRRGFSGSFDVHDRPAVLPRHPKIYRNLELN